MAKVNEMFLEELAYRLRTARKQRHLSQRTVSARTYVCENAIRALENMRGGNLTSALVLMRFYGMNVVEDVQQVASRLRFQRRIREISQKAVAMQTGMSENSIWHIERNCRAPRLDTLIKMCDAIGVDAWTILEA